MLKWFKNDELSYFDYEEKGKPRDKNKKDLNLGLLSFILIVDYSHGPLIKLISSF